MAARLAAATLLTLTSCAQHRPVPSAPAVVAPTGVSVPPTTTLPPTTAPHPPVVTAPASTAPPPTGAVGGGGDVIERDGDVIGTGQDDAFWRRLADCECASGHCGGGHVGWFQFSADTARKVGIDGSEGYEEQRAAAQEWARRIHPNEGTTAGWPHCWGVAS